MKIRNITVTIASICLISGVSIAQESTTEGVETTTSRTYKVNMGDKVVSKSVEISTKTSEAIAFNEEDMGKVDQDRKTDTMPMITKTVRIDNDEDDAFDEKIVFTYSSNTSEDFVLVSDKNQLMVAIDDGTDLKILEDMNLKPKSDATNNATYVFTNKNGKEIEFMVKEHSSS